MHGLCRCWLFSPSIMTLACPCHSLPMVLPFLSSQFDGPLVVLAEVNASHALFFCHQLLRWGDYARLIKIRASDFELTFGSSLLRIHFVGRCSFLVLVPHLVSGLKADECAMSILTVHFFFLLRGDRGLCSFVSLRLRMNFDCTRSPIWWFKRFDLSALVLFTELQTLLLPLLRQIYDPSLLRLCLRALGHALILRLIFIVRLYERAFTHSLFSQ